MAQRIVVQDGRVIYTSSDPTTVDVDFSIAGNLDVSKNISIAGNPLPTTRSTILNYNSASIVTALSLPANSIVLNVEVVIYTTFNGSPTLSVGITGNISKYAQTGAINLNDVVGDVSYVYSGRTPNVSAETVRLYYAAGGATVGQARVIITYIGLNV